MMKFKTDHISIILFSVAALPAAMATPLPKHHAPSTFQEAIETVAEHLADKAAKEFGSGKMFFLIFLSNPLMLTSEQPRTA